MKYKYDTLSKQEKKDLKIEYKNSEENKLFYKKIKRVIILCDFGIIYAIVMMIIDFVFKMSLINKVLDCLLLIFSLGFLVRANDILKMNINKYLISKKK